MNNADYWARRFAAVESENHKKAVMAAEDIEKAYRDAEKRLQKEISVWYARLAANNDVSIEEARRMMSRQELDEFKWDVARYIKAMEDNEYSGAWVKELENASARYHISKYEGMQIRLRQEIEAAYAEQQGIMDHHLRDIFGETYYRTAYELQSGLHTGFEIAAVNEKQIESVLKRPWAADGKAFSDRIWLNKEQLVKKLDTEITRNIMLGRGISESSAAIAKEFKTSESRAATLVYTETAYVASEAQKSSYKELGVEQYEIVATLDNVTSDICQEMDGKHFPMKDFVVGVTAPPFHPNCRSVTVPYFDDEYSELFEGGMRAARDEDGKTVYVPEDMKYPEWKEKFVKDSATEYERDVSQEYVKNSSPGKGAISYEQGYDFEKHHDEIETAEWLLENLGGKISLLNESLKDGVKMPDYEWNGKFWELKSPGTAEAANSAVRKAIKQISPNPGGIILNYGNGGADLNSIIGFVDKRMQWLKEGIEIDVMLIINGKMEVVLRYKK